MRTYYVFRTDTVYNIFGAFHIVDAILENEFYQDMQHKLLMK